jgi:hypothetical protein
VHGGFDGAQCLSDAFVLDTHTLVWSRIDLDGECTLVGRTVALHTMCSFAHGLLMYGGACNNAVLNSCTILHNCSLTQGHKLAFSSQSAVAITCAIERKLAECTAERDTFEAQVQHAEDEKKARPRNNCNIGVTVSSGVE